MSSTYITSNELLRLERVLAKARLNWSSIRISGAQEIGLLCSDCGYETRKAVSWVRRHSQLECPNCGRIIDVESRNFRAIV
jgi:DNA-directed RNA polymerase subunit RPC12/RpoP